MNLSKLINQEIFVKNLFTLLYTDKNAKLADKKSFSLVVKELNIPQEMLNNWLGQWKADTKTLSFQGDSNDIIDMYLYLYSALLNDEPLLDSAVDLLNSASVKNGLDKKITDSINSNRTSFLPEKSFLKRFDSMKEKAGIKIPGKKMNPENSGSGSFYIANQLTYEGLDELQRLVLAYNLGVHTALDGPPGVGKTMSIIEVSKILGMNLFTKTCSTRTTESHIVSFPVLTVQDGVSVTAQENGPLVRAMVEPAIFYGDEFNLLKEDVQKRLNSAFDDRSSIDRMDGIEIHAKPGFWGVISYNPTQNLVARDLEESVADRFIHLHYERWSADFKAFVATCRTTKSPDTKFLEKQFNIQLEWRGISSGGRFYKAEEENGKKKWYDFFTGLPAKDEPEYVYRAHDRNSIFKDRNAEVKKTLENLAEEAFGGHELSRMISRFTELLHSLVQTGESTLLKKIGLSDLKEKEDLELLSLHESSTRIEVSALKHYYELLGKGCNKYLAQSYAVRLVIDQVCYGQYRDKKLRENTVYSLVTMIAKNMRLFADNTKYNTKMITDSLLKS